MSSSTQPSTIRGMDVDENGRVSDGRHYTMIVPNQQGRRPLKDVTRGRRYDDASAVLARDLNYYYSKTGIVPKVYEIADILPHTKGDYYKIFGEKSEWLKAANILSPECKEGDMARELNQLQYREEVIGPPKRSHVRNLTSFTEHEYREHFGGHEQQLRAANITPTSEHTIDAIVSFVESGNSYAKTKQLRHHMYPKADLKHRSRLFGISDQYTQGVCGDSNDFDKQEVMDSWEYPRLSATDVGKTLSELASGERESSRVDVSVWSDAQKATYKFTLNNDSE